MRRFLRSLVTASCALLSQLLALSCHTLPNAQGLLPFLPFLLSRNTGSKSRRADVFSSLPTALCLQLSLSLAWA